MEGGGAATPRGFRIWGRRRTARTRLARSSSWPARTRSHSGRAAGGQQAPCFFVVLGGEGEKVALFGEGGELEVSAEVAAARGDGLGPAFDAGGERGVDVLESLFGCGGGWAAGLSDAVEDAAG